MNSRVIRTFLNGFHPEEGLCPKRLWFFTRLHCDIFLSHQFSIFILFEFLKTLPFCSKQHKWNQNPEFATLHATSLRKERPLPSPGAKVYSFFPFVDAFLLSFIISLLTFDFVMGWSTKTKCSFFTLSFTVSLSSLFLTQSDGNTQVAKLMSVFGELCVQECKEGSPQVREVAAWREKNHL